MSKSFLFTHERLSKLLLPEVGRQEYFDIKQQKLRVRITSTGVKSFSVVKKLNGKPKRVTIGRFPEISIAKARDEAIKILDEMRQGSDPVASKRKRRIEQTKLKDVLEMYLAERDLKPYTMKDYRYKLQLGFFDWLNKPVNHITEAMVLKRHKKISQTGKTTANTTMRVLRLTLNYALALGMLVDNPVDILSKARLWHKDRRREEIIPSNKLRDWYVAVVSLQNTKAKVYLLTLLYMGFRSDETLTMEWDSVNLKDNTITLLDTKNRTDHLLPIPVPLIPYFKELNVITGSSRWVFAGIDLTKPMSVPNKPIAKVIKSSGVRFSPHVCRHTFTTIAEAAYLPHTMIKRLTNHVTTNDVTGGYIHTELDTLREAINKIARSIQGKVMQEGNVISLHG